MVQQLGKQFGSFLKTKKTIRETTIRPGDRALGHLSLRNDVRTKICT